MFTWRVAGAVVALVLLNLKLTTCRSPSKDAGGAAPANGTEQQLELAGVDTSELTGREKSEWSALVTDVLAPCPEQPVPLAQCVKEQRACPACTPAANFLVTEVLKGKARSQVESAYRARFSPDSVQKIDVTGSPAKGAEKPSVLIVEWADFECPACGAAREVLDSLIEQYPNHVRLVFKHFPLSIHPNAETAARAAVAAQKQGKFWAMHRALFESQDRGLDRVAIERIARETGVDMKQFSKDLDSESVADIVARDRKQGEAVDLSGTPTIYINGRLFKPGPDFGEELLEWVKLEIMLVTGKRAVESKRGDAQPAAPAPALSANGNAKQAAKEEQR
jgi:predicted DsbA family dithiol-disulfide isomerase